MNHQGLLVGIGILSVAMITAGLWLVRALGRQDVRDRRIAMAQAEAGIPPPMVQGRGGALGVVASLGALMARSGLLPASTRAELEYTLTASGFRPGEGLALFLGGKLLLLLLLPPIAFAVMHHFDVSPTVRMLAVGGTAIVGLLFPDHLVRRWRSRYLAAVNIGLPDALDMLVICSEAGLGLEQSLERVSAEIEPAHAAVAAELKTTSAELRILSDRRTALTNMGTRTGLDTLKRLGATLIQTMQYGTPLSQALRTLSTEMRFETLMRFEASAARLPVLLTVPMILFILPCIFIVVGGPAGLTVVRTLITK